MKKTFILLTLVFAGTVAFNTPAQTRGRSTNTTVTNTTTARPAAASTSARPATSTTRPGSSTTTTRPTTTTTRPSATTTRPGTSTTTTRPGSTTTTTTTRPGTVTRPGASTSANATQRPGTPVAPSRPTTPTPSTKPGNNNHPGGTAPQPPRPNVVPPRPHTPPSFNYFRPTPPPSWRPTTSSPRFGSILGVALGTFINNSVNSLINSGYSVTGSTTNEVYLSNVTMYNVVWPDVTMYYTNGYLAGSLFAYSSVNYDSSRYNYVYNNITSQYGMPVSTQSLNNGGMSCTWWGYNNDYITLSFYPEYISGLGTRYFTTLSMGN